MDVTPVTSGITSHTPVAPTSMEYRQVDYNTNDGKPKDDIPDFYLDPPAPSNINILNSNCNIVNTGNNNDDELTKRLEELLEKEKVLTNSANKANKANKA